ncbi:MAG: VCBS repeat-containing protein [Saprospiraceae bacterium]
MNSIKNILLLILFQSLLSCGTKEDLAPPALFQLLEKDQTGLDVENTLTQSAEFNVFTYMYFFNGGGLAAGDFNQDGWVDLYFTNNMESNKLFLNQQGLRFKDVTAEAGVAGLPGWTTGATIVDINNDGLLDIYVSQVGDYGQIKGANQLYVCQKIEAGVPIFENKAADYGLDLVGFGTQAAFFDYDLDGDLDMYQLNHSLHQNGTFGKRSEFGEQHPLSGDKLMRNDNGTFVNVNEAAGIYSTVIGYGLGIVTGDINNDGWPDIYIGNDFHENDYLYLNQQDGTFKEVLTEQLNHTSRFSMGVDMADINNDGFSEILSLDMLPYDPYILKSSLGEDGVNIFKFKLGYGYNPQFSRNNLQLNNGDGTFSEIGMFAGIYATDWSWAPLLMDFDQDGYRDIFISNGIPRRMNDIDYINFKTGLTENEDDLSYVEKMPQVRIPNKFYHNPGNLNFEDVTGQVKHNKPSYSNGAIYADLDNDGDLDIVVNNIEDSPFIYENKSNTLTTDSETHQYLDFQLEGSPQNKLAIGARIIVYKGQQRIIQEHFPVRGYQSSLAPGLNIGVGDAKTVDSVLVIWPDRSYQHLDQLTYNQKTVLKWTAGLPLFSFNQIQESPKVVTPYAFTDVTEAVRLNFKHEENPFIDFNREGLMPHMISAEGPALAVGDINGDGLEDVFLGSSKRMRSAIYWQRPNGTFELKTPSAIVQDSLLEDVDAVLVDIENDGDLDLVIASGGNEYKLGNKDLIQRAYLNDGKGNFTRKELFPGAFLTAACVLPADFNGDGLVDFFFGARAVPWNYGLIPHSFLYQNNGDGTFKEVTTSQAEGLQQVGLVKEGAWADMDGDGDQDLLLALEWDAIQLFQNDGGVLKKHPLNDAKGWWNFVLPYDFDGDGDLDILAGNLGQNARFKPTKEEPIRCYVNDFDDNDQVEQVLTYYVDGKEIPFSNFAELTKQMVSLKKRFLYAREMAAATPADIFGQDKLDASLVHQLNMLQSAYFENTGDGLSFKMMPLPAKLQFSTLNAAAIVPASKGKGTSVILGGNFLESNIEMGWYDANYGNLLSVQPGGEMVVSTLGKQHIKGQVRRIAAINIKGKPCYIFAKNNDKLQVLEIALSDALIQ